MIQFTISPKGEKLNNSSVSIDCSRVGFQPNHPQNKVDGGRLENVWGSKEPNSFNFDGDVRSHHVNMTLPPGVLTAKGV